MPDRQPRDAAPGPRRSAVFLDRDGVINIDRGYVFRPADLAFTPTVLQAIALFNAARYLVIVVTNQSGVARGFYGTADVDHFHDVMAARVREAGGHIDAFYYSPHHPDGTVAPYAGEHPDRKPNPGMILRAMADFAIDPATSVMIGDKPSDVEAGIRAGIRAVLVEPDVCDLLAEARAILATPIPGTPLQG